MAFKTILTDPKTHGKNFVYIVHAINTYGKQADPNIAKDSIDRMLDAWRNYSASLVGMLDAEAAEKIFGQAREIKLTGIYGDSFGIIVNPSFENQISIASHLDFASPHSCNPDALASFVNGHLGKIEDPLTLLTKAIMRNQIILCGSHSIDQIQGIFISESEKSNPGLSLENAMVFKSLLRERHGLEVPVVSAPYYNNFVNGKDYSEEIDALMNF